MGENASRVLVVSPDYRLSVRAVLHGLMSRGLLRRFVTPYVYVPGGWEDRVLKMLPRIGELMVRRRLAEELRPLTTCHPSREWLRIIGSRLGLPDVWQDRLWESGELWFSEKVAAEHVQDGQLVYGFEHASLNVFLEQKRRRGHCMLGQLIAHHRASYRILQEEIERFPEAATEYDRRALRTASRVNARKDEEYETADLIFVNSGYVLRTFLEAGVPRRKLVVIPTAADGIVRAGPAEPRGETIFLCVANLSLRKGTLYLLDAWRKLKVRSGARLVLIGKNTLPSGALGDLPSDVTVLPSMPRQSVFEWYQKASVFVLPTLCEGFAFVIHEALAFGLPVITTENSGCGRFVEDGKNGWIVPIRDSEALARKMERFIDHPSDIAEMGGNSIVKSKQWMLNDYGREHSNIVLQFMQDPENFSAERVPQPCMLS